MSPHIDNNIRSEDTADRTINLVGFFSAIFTVVITLVTFSLAIIAVPISGANCFELCIDYPYLDAAAQYPKDFRWMVPAMVLALSYLILMVSIHFYAPQRKKIFSQIGLSFASIAALILLGDYFLQFSIIPISLMSGETEGLALLIQYNPHGIFIALEELGYLMMSLSFLFYVPIFSNKSRLETAIRWIFLIGFLLTVAALTLVSIYNGLDRQDRFEIAVISIDWLVLVINGILLSILFRRNMIQKEAIA